MLDKNIKPLGDRVVIESPKSKNTTESGKILLTESVGRGKAVWGTVISVGNGVYTQNGKLIPMEVKLGDEVLYKKDMIGDPTEIEGQKYIIFREQDLLMVRSKKSLNG